jgi:outer membrane protein TolC
MTLEQAVAYAVRHNPTVGEAAGLITQARGFRIQARAARLPQAGVNNYIYRQGPVVPSAIPGGNPAVPGWRYNVGVFINQVLFDWGQRRNAENAAKHDVTAAQYRQEETENNVRLVVGTTFFNILRAQELVIVAEERVASATEQLRVAKARFESDVAPRFDVIRSEAELANAQQELIQAQNQVALAEANFNQALGRDVNTAVVINPEAQPARSDFSFRELRSTASAKRPTIQAYLEDIRGLEDTVRSRRAENKPQISLGATYDRPNPGGFASTDYHYTLGLVMTWPFFDGFFTRGRVREAQGTLEARKFRLESERQQVELDIKQGQLDVDEALKRVETSRKEQASAREALRVAEVRYRSGVGTNVEVTDAQVAVARAGQDLANAEFDFLTALVRLEFATGSSVAGLTGETPKVVPDSKRTEPGKTPATASPPPRM